MNRTTINLRCVILRSLVRFNHDVKALALAVSVTKDDIVLNKYGTQLNHKMQNKLCRQVKKTQPIVENEVRRIWHKCNDYDLINVVGIADIEESQLDDKAQGYDHRKERIRNAAALISKSLLEQGATIIDFADFPYGEATSVGSLLATWKANKNTWCESQAFRCINMLNEEERGRFKLGKIKANAQNFARFIASGRLSRKSLFKNLNVHFPDDIKKAIHDKSSLSQNGFQILMDMCDKNDGAIILDLHWCVGKPQSDDSYILIGDALEYAHGGWAPAAAVIATMKALSELGREKCFKDQSISVRALIPIIQCNQYTKGQYLKHCNKKQTQILDTTMVSGLIHSDLLHFACKEDPAMVLDVTAATDQLVYTNLHQHASAVFTNSRHLSERIKQAAFVSGDRIWKIPLGDHKRCYLSNTADYVNSCENNNHLVVASYLHEFVKPNQKWMHIDISGSRQGAADTLYLNDDMSGRPTRAIIDLILGLVFQKSDDKQSRRKHSCSSMKKHRSSENWSHQEANQFRSLTNQLDWVKPCNKISKGSRQTSLGYVNTKDLLSNQLMIQSSHEINEINQQSLFSKNTRLNRIKCIEMIEQRLKKRDLLPVPTLQESLDKRKMVVLRQAMDRNDKQIVIGRVMER